MGAAGAPGRAVLGLMVVGLVAAACAGPAELTGPPPGEHPVPAPARGLGLPTLPLGDVFNGPRRQVLTVNSYDGKDRMANSASGVTVNQNNGQWLELDATTASNYAWAIWRLAESPDGAFEQFQINCVGAGQTPPRYYLAYGNYAKPGWVFHQLDTKPEGFIGSITVNPADLPGGEAMLHSPGGFAYFAILAAPDNAVKLQVKGIDVTTPGGTLPGVDPIFDQFEDNDTLATATPLAPGAYKASIHQSFALEMQDINERRDYIDCYSVTVPAGKILTATLRHETFDHFGSGFENDADLLFYFPTASDIGNDFDEALSSYGIWYDPFEQVNFGAGDGSSYYLVVLGDTTEPGVRTNAEYELGISLSDAVYTVSGSITQSGQALDKDVIVFLEPGNFNAATPVPGSGTPGNFTIQGVPPGDYTLKVHGVARFGPTGYVWPESLALSVVNGNLSSQDLEIGADPS